ncbi:MAG: hypothetical protein ALECFALPRED_005121 [Alectoria fallacina]|uniref:Fe2OG dioxygenase domain-containing protein n=1 Tax=Alectoria fallacina TaxID=1903189 RepID=A0A8H3FW69_9LECA|nr:MAG: hypothetical protein ALECFALPRED_005121 [Alectoria fallacina]
MASSRLFEAYPPFPVDVPTAILPKISLDKLSSGSEAEANELFHACRTKGFFLLDLQNEPAGDGLLRDIEALFAITREVMDLSLEEKTEYKQHPPLLGYKAAGIMKNEKGQPDRCEFFNVGQDDIRGNIPRRANPKPVQDNRETFMSFMDNASRVLFRIFGILEAQLGLPTGTLAALHRQDQPSGTVVRMIRYPPQTPRDHGSSLLNHTDYGTITMLCNVLGGLQILPPGASNEDSNWQYVKPQPNCVIVNLGDALVEWTGDILRSNEHRVIAAPGKQAEHARFSVAFLVRPERKVSMKRLVGGKIPTAAEDGKEELSVSADEWELKKAVALIAGADCARSKGGRELRTTNVPVKVG